MGCDPIVFVGQDLAYTGGRAYAPGTVYEDSLVKLSADGKSIGHEWCDTMRKTHESAPSKLSEGQRTEQIRAWGNEGFVYSTGSFGHIRLWLERVAALMGRAEGGARLINATEGGAHIAGFEELALKEVLAELPERPISREEIIARARQNGRQPSRDDVMRFFKSQAEGARRVAKTATELAEGSRTALLKWQAKDPRLTALKLKEIQSLEVRLKETVARSPWVDAWAWEAIDLELENKEVSGEDETGGLAAEARLGEIIAKAALELAELLETQTKGLTVA
jgi:hypothetical protein